jgi:hypothetical protein
MKLRALLTLAGELAVSDPKTFDSESLLGRVVVLQIAQAGSP